MDSKILLLIVGLISSFLALGNVIVYVMSNYAPNIITINIVVILFILLVGVSAYFMISFAKRLDEIL